MKNLIWNEFKGKKFKIIKKYKDEFRDILANFGKSKGKYSAFGAFYELYLYAFAIGLHSNKRVGLEGQELETFNAVYEWSGNKPNILNTFLIALLSIESIRQEAEFDFPSLSMEELEENEIKKRVNNLVRIFEEFANGGFEIINNKYVEDPERFEHHSGLQRLFEEIVDVSVLN